MLSMMWAPRFRGTSVRAHCRSPKGDHGFIKNQSDAGRGKSPSRHHFSLRVSLDYSPVFGVTFLPGRHRPAHDGSLSAGGRYQFSHQNSKASKRNSISPARTPRSSQGVIARWTSCMAPRRAWGGHRTRRPPRKRLDGMIGVRQGGEIGNPELLPFDPPGCERLRRKQRDPHFQHAPCYPSSRPG
jgi:hypothetical protein